MATDSHKYEVTFILGESASTEDAQAKTVSVTDFIKEQGGQVTQQELWGRRELAYEIKRNRNGFYVTLWFDAPGTIVKALEEHLRFDTEVIRSLITKAYTSAQPGTLSPVAEEEEKAARRERSPRTEDKSSAEESLRRSSSATPSKKEGEEEEALPEEERLKKLDESLEELLKDETAV
jgi:small subunit ribosomal protein S6